MGQVATTIMVAHTTAVRNGKRIQVEAAINTNRNTTASVSRVRFRLPFCHGYPLCTRSLSRFSYPAGALPPRGPTM